MKQNRKWYNFLLSPYWLPALLGTFSITLIASMLKYESFRGIVNDNYTLFQLSTTLILSTVGVWTVVNTTISARSASKSLDLSLQNKLKDETAKIIIIEKGISGPFSPPSIYKHFYTFLNKKLHENFRGNITKSNLTQNLDEYIERTLASENSIVAHKEDYFLEIVNIGKGPGIGIRYSFELLNWSDYEAKPYEFYSKNYIETSSLGYKMTIEKMSNVNNIVLEVELEDGLDDDNKLKYTGFSLDHFFVISQGEIDAEAFNYLKPSDSFKIFIPIEFIILAQQYVITSKIPIENRSENYPIFNSPTLKLELEYRDEMIIKNNENNLNPTHKIEYHIKLDEKSIKFTGNLFKLNLALNLVKRT